MLELPYKGVSSSPSYERRKSCVQSYLYEKNKDPHSCSLSFTNIHGMLGIMEKQFQCYEVRRRRMKILRVAQPGKPVAFWKRGPCSRSC